MTSPSPSVDFRQDINALRAWAVVAVVLFHFAVPGFTGGFVGVDVFFVISGYLMTRIIMSGLVDGSERPFSLGRFYLARARRIIPALLMLTVVLLCAGWWLLTASDYERLGNHAVYALLFWSNVKFWREAGYFDTESGEKWLLHTWSLSVEWQFYLLLPVVILLVWRCRQAISSVVVVYVVTLLSGLAWSTWLSWHEPEAAFYGLHSRAWEMLAGGLVYFLEPRLSRLRRSGLITALTGYGMIFTAIAWLDKSHSWPGLTALLPVTGTMLVIAACHPQNWLNAAPGLQWVGARSYSIYLWHWPVAVAMGYLGIRHDATTLTAAMLLVLILSVLSYHFVEQTFQRVLSGLRVARSALVLLALVAIAFAGAQTIKSHNGVPERLSAAVLAVEREAENINPRREHCHGGSGNVHPECVFGSEPVGVVMLGDSHASAVVTALQVAGGPQAGVLTMSYTSCPTIAGVRMVQPGHGCPAFNAWALQRLTELPVDLPVVIVNRSSAYLFGETTHHGGGQPAIHFGRPSTVADGELLAQSRSRMLSTYCAIARQRRVYVLAPLPEMPEDVPGAMARAMMQGRPVGMSIGLDDYAQRHAFVRDVLRQAAHECGVIVLDPLPYLCRGGRCQGDSGGWPRYYDDNHLSESGNRLLVPMFRQVWR